MIIKVIQLYKYFSISSTTEPSCFFYIRPWLLRNVVSILEGALLLFILYLYFCYSLTLFEKI